MSSWTTPVRALGSGLGIAVLAVAVFLLWPVQLGGWTAYAVVDGTSMEPGLASGDLVLTRARGDYGVGDAVLYESDLLGENVLHRIVGEENGRFTFRGDNRDEDDPEQLTEAAILGSLWLAAPGVGHAVAWLGRPVNLAIAVFVLVLLVLAGGRELSRRRRRGVDPVPVAFEPEPEPGPGRLVPAGAGRGLLVAGGVALVGFAGLALVAWSHGETSARTVVGGYAHSGTFAYEAAARRGAAYPDGKVATGQPVFVRLSRTVEVAFDYRFVAERPARLRGAVALAAVLSDGDGWSRTLPLRGEAPFTGPSTRVVGVLDLRELLGIAARVRASTGSELSPLRVTVVPEVSVMGAMGETALDERFAPELRLTLDTVSLRLDEGTPSAPTTDGDTAVAAASPLAPRSEGATIVVEPASLALGSLLEVEVGRARSLALVGLAAALATLGLGLVLLLREGGGSEGDRIAARYGSRIVRARATIPAGRWVTDLHDVEALVRLAETYDRVVLRVVEPDGGEAFLVDDGIALYRYRPERPGPLGTPRALPAHGR